MVSEMVMELLRKVQREVAELRVDVKELREGLEAQREQREEWWNNSVSEQASMRNRVNLLGTKFDELDGRVEQVERELGLWKRTRKRQEAPE